MNCRIDTWRAKMNNYVVIDIETSGLDENKDEIIELSALKIENGEITDRFSSLCKPSKPLLKEVEIWTGITNGDLNDKPMIKDVLPNFLRFIGCDVIIAYNEQFDFKFINVALKKANLPSIKNEIIDIYALSKEKCEIENYDIYSVAEALEIDEIKTLLYAEIIFRVYEKLKNMPSVAKRM